MKNQKIDLYDELDGMNESLFRYKKKIKKNIYKLKKYYIK